MCLLVPPLAAAGGLALASADGADLVALLTVVTAAVSLGVAIAAMILFRRLPTGAGDRRTVAIAGGLAAVAVPANLAAGAFVELVDALGRGLHGRPWRVRGVAHRTPVRRGPFVRNPGGAALDPWTDADLDLDTVRIEAETLSPSVRATLADAWAKDGSLEHASVAAFSSLSLDLLALGAPPSLLRRVQEAALDEIDHAASCFALASVYAGHPIGPDALVAPEELAPPAETLAGRRRRVLLETAVDGCIGEAAAATIARVGAESAENTAVKLVLARIARDEARHAELAWDLLVYLLDEMNDAPLAELLDGLGNARELLPDHAAMGADAHGQASSGAWAEARRVAHQHLVEELTRRATGAIEAA